MIKIKRFVEPYSFISLTEEYPRSIGVEFILWRKKGRLAISVLKSIPRDCWMVLLWLIFVNIAIELPYFRVAKGHVQLGVYSVIWGKMYDRDGEVVPEEKLSNESLNRVGLRLKKFFFLKFLYQIKSNPRP